MDKPNLGLATTGEILDELRARIEMHALGGLYYRTVDGEMFASLPANCVSSRLSNCCEQDEGA